MAQRVDFNVVLQGLQDAKFIHSEQRSKTQYTSNIFEMIFFSKPADEKKIQVAICLCMNDKRKSKHNRQRFAGEGYRFYSMLSWVSCEHNNVALR